MTAAAQHFAPIPYDLSTYSAHSRLLAEDRAIREGILVQHSSTMHRSDQYALAIAALSAIGTDLVVQRGRAARMSDTGTFDDLENERRRPGRRSRGSSGRQNSASSRSMAHTTRTVSSRSSTKSLSKASRSKGKDKSKAKSMTSKASYAKASSIGSVASASSRRRTVITVAPQPKLEKYVPPPRGTFRSSYTRYLRSEVLGGVISGLTVSDPVPLLTESSGALDQKDSSPSVQPQQLSKRAPLDTVAVPRLGIKLEDLPTLALAEFDFFSASRSRTATLRETSEVWGRSPAAPEPPKMRRWLKNARNPPVGTVEEVEEQIPQNAGGGGQDIIEVANE